MTEKKLGYIGCSYAKNYDGEKFTGYRILKDDPLLIDYSQKEHTIVFAKSGSGKTYLAGVIAEELIRLMHDYAVIILDPIGNFSTLSKENEGKEVAAWNKALERTDVIPEGIRNFKIWIPASDIGSFTHDMYDHVFSLRPNSITTSTLCFAFNMKPLDPQIRLFVKAQRKLSRIDPDYTLQFLHDYIFDHGEEMHYKPQTVEAIITKLDALEELGLIDSEYGYNIHEIVKPGVMVFNMSMGSDYVKKIIVNFFTEQLLPLRKRITNLITDAKKRGTCVYIPDRIPPVHLVIDEAHKFITKENEIIKAYVKEGRNVGCILTAISQSPDLTQDVYENFHHLFVGQLVYDESVMKVRSMLPIFIKPDEWKRKIKTLNVGCFLYFNVDQKVQKEIRVRPRKTMHPASTKLEDERIYLIGSGIDLRKQFLEHIGKNTWKFEDLPAMYLSIIPEMEEQGYIKTLNGSLMWTLKKWEGE